VLIPRHSEVYGRVNSERNLKTQKKLVLRNSQNSSTKLFVRTSKVGIPRVCFFCSRNGIPSIFLFRGMVRNGIPRVCFYFFPLYRIPSIFLFQGMVRNGTVGIPPERTNCSVHSVFRGIIFLSEIANPNLLLSVSFMAISHDLANFPYSN
jgi:hypothetical protein